MILTPWPPLSQQGAGVFYKGGRQKNENIDRRTLFEVDSEGLRWFQADRTQ